MKRASRTCRDKFWSELGLKNIEWKKENGMAQQQSPVWFITGCSTGFGKELAKLVLARGWRAVVTARNPDQLKELVSGQEENALAVQLDVTDRAQIAQAVQQTEEKFGRIDVLAGC
jgi:NAD(P)-dependent dehydrogenase (short-subunit alcohol dehydrogenase family)